MTYGQSFDPYNFQFAIRYLQVKFIRNHQEVIEEHFLSFNNSNQMVWKSSGLIAQVIKFDPLLNQMILSICEPHNERLYSLSLNRGNISNIGSIQHNLLFTGRKLKIHSKFTCNTKQIDSIDAASCSGKFSFNNSLSVIFLLLFVILL